MSIYQLGDGFDLDNIIEYQINRVIRGVGKRLTIKQKYINPWTYSFDLDVFHGVQLAIYNALDNYSGVYKCCTQKEKKFLIVKFDDLYSLHYHLYNLTNKKILPKKFFNKIIMGFILFSKKPLNHKSY